METVFEAIGERIGETDRTSVTLTVALVDDIDAVTAPMTTRNALRLAIKTHSETEVGKLAHRVLHCEVGGDASAHWNGALHATVSSATSWSQTRGLEREDLVLSELLLVERLLLLLQGLDLGLNSDLWAEDEIEHRY